MGVGTDDDGSSLEDDGLEEELELICSLLLLLTKLEELLGSWLLLTELAELLETTLLVLLLDGFSVLLDELLEITLLEEDKEDVEVNDESSINENSENTNMVEDVNDVLYEVVNEANTATETVNNESLQTSPLTKEQELENAWKILNTQPIK